MADQSDVLKIWPQLKILFDRNKEVLQNKEYVLNPDNSVSTVFSAGIEDERINDGKPTLIPTVWGGKKVAVDRAIEYAVKYSKERNIKWPSFKTIDESTEAARAASSVMKTPYDGSK